jgi:hypothetical protein
MIRILSIALLAWAAACIDPSAVANQQNDPLTFTHPDDTVTTVCDAQCDTDAKVLTLRYQSEILLNKDLLGDYAWVLRKARAASPSLCTVTATAVSDPQSIIVQPIDGAIAAAWGSGTVATGVPSIDGPLGTIGVSSIDASAASFDLYVVHLAQSVNVMALASALTSTQEVQAFTNDYSDPVTHDITATRQGTSTLLSFSTHDTGTTSVTVTDAGVVTTD